LNSEIYLTPGVTTASVATNANTSLHGTTVNTTGAQIMATMTTTEFDDGSPRIVVSDYRVSVGCSNILTNEQLFELIENGAIPHDTRRLNITCAGKITDYSPLNRLPYLSSLYLSGNQTTGKINDISSLSKLTNLEELEELYLSYSQITDLTPLSKLTNLRDLYLSENQITDITPLSELTKLEYLSLGNNQMRDISPLSKLINLQILYIYNNEINDITPLSELTKLQDLNLSNNQITDITPLATLKNLYKLYVDYEAVNLEGVRPTREGKYETESGELETAWSIFAEEKGVLCAMFGKSNPLSQMKELCFLELYRVK
jgi:Leucine-rich repeat (LRR) protein